MQNLIFKEVDSRCIFLFSPPSDVLNTLDLSLYLHYFKLGVYKNMMYKLYSIYDKDAQEYGPLFNAKNDIVASRYVEEMIKDVNHVDSYALYCMGEYDTENGISDTNVSFISDCSNLIEIIEDGV